MAVATTAAVHELDPQQSDLNDVKRAFLRFLHLTDYVSIENVKISNLLEQWACGNSKTTRVFTDQWPDCTCVVMFYCYNSVVPREVDLCLPGGDSTRVLQVLLQPGVIDWSKSLRFTKVMKYPPIEGLLAAQNNPSEKRLGIYAKVKMYHLFQPITLPQQILPDKFYFQSLDTSYCKYIAQYWSGWAKMSSQFLVERFRNCISVGGVGIFTDSTTPHKLVSWAVRSADGGEIHHLYTLEEYRGRGLASAVVREMSRRIQDKGEVPFCEILPGSTVSSALFKGLGFVEEEELYCFLKHDSEQR